MEARSSGRRLKEEVGESGLGLATADWPGRGAGRGRGVRLRAGRCGLRTGRAGAQGEAVESGSGVAAADWPGRGGLATVDLGGRTMHCSKNYDWSFLCGGE